MKKAGEAGFNPSIKVRAGNEARTSAFAKATADRRDLCFNCLTPMSGKRGSNSRPSAWEADALPTELLPPALRFGGQARLSSPNVENARMIPATYVKAMLSEKPSNAYFVGKLTKNASILYAGRTDSCRSVVCCPGWQTRSHDLL